MFRCFIYRMEPQKQLQLINTKCIPILLHGLEACPLLKSDLSSLDFVKLSIYEIIQSQYIL